MKRSTLVVLTLVATATAALPFFVTQTYAADPGGSHPASARKAVAMQQLNATPGRAATLPRGVNGAWAIDPQHSRIGFAVRHVMINDVHGSFNDFSGTIVVNEKDISKSSVDFTAKVDSIDTNVPQRDAHLKSSDFFDAGKYPEITFKSTRIERAGEGFRAIGTLTMHGVSKSISIPFRASGPVVDGFGYTRAGIQANLQLNRQDYGVKWNEVLDNGGLAVDNIVRISLDLEAVKEGTGPEPEVAKTD